MSTDLANIGLNALGSEINLVVTIGNAGPTTIVDAFFSVYLPLQRSSITGIRYFLYPSGISPGVSNQKCINNDSCLVLNP